MRSHIGRCLLPASLAVAGAFSILGACTSDGDDGGSGTDANAPDDSTAPPTDSTPDGTTFDAAREAMAADGGPILSLVAGRLGAAGYLDLVGGDARMTVFDVVRDDSTNALWILSGDGTVRRLDVATGMVTTVSGVYGQVAMIDGPKTSARFDSVYGGAYDPATHSLYLPEDDGIRSLDVTSGAVKRIVDGGGLVDPVKIRYPDAGPDAGDADAGPPIIDTDLLVHPHQLALDPIRHRLYVSGDACEIKVINTSTMAVVATWGWAQDCRIGDGTTSTDADAGEGLTSAIRFLAQSRLGVAINPAAGTLYVLDANALRIVDTTGNASSTTVALDPALNLSGFVAWDATAKKVYVSGQNAVYAIDPQTQAVAPLAGLAGTYGVDDGLASAARLQGPEGLAVFPGSSTVFVADMTTVRTINAGVVTTVAGTAQHPGAVDATGSNARFAQPLGVAYDSAKNVAYVADSVNLTLRAVDLATTNVTTVAGYPSVSGSKDGAYMTSTFKSPYSVAFDPNAKVVYVADRDSFAIRAYDTTTGLLSTLVGDPTNEGFQDGPKVAALLYEPTSLTYDAASHTLYFVDGFAIRTVDTLTREVKTITGVKDGPFDIVDGDKTVARFIGPNGLAYDAARKLLYVTDSGTVDNVHRYGVIRAVDVTTGNVSTLAGRLDATDFIDGPKSTAAFRAPTGLVLDPAGSTLYVTDLWTLRAVSVTTGAVSTRFGGSERVGVHLGPLAGASLRAGAGLSFAGPDLLLVDSAECALLRASGL